MPSKDVQDYLEKGMYGAPQLKPEEKRQYLGTFRERVYLTMTIAEMRDKKNVTHFKQELQDNPGQQLLLNAAADFSLQNNYMIIAQKANCPFKIIDSDEALSDETIGLVYAGDTAVNVEKVAVSEKYAPVRKTSEQVTATAEKPEEKTSFFAKLFKK